MKFKPLFFLSGMILIFVVSSCKTKQMAKNNSNVLETTEADKSFKFIDKANMDLSVAPGDNFFEYVNGSWLKNTKIPDDKTRWGSFDELRDKTNMAVQDLLNYVSGTPHLHPAGSKEYNVGHFYNSGMDVEQINSLGLEAIRPQLNLIKNINNTEQLTEVIVALTKKGIYTVLSAYIGPDDKDVTKVIPQFNQGGLGLPTKDYYTDKDANSEANRKAYQKLITDFLILNGQSPQEAVKNAEAVFAIEDKLAKASLYPAEMRDPQKMYNKFSLADISTKTPGLNWQHLFHLMSFEGEDSVIVSNISYYTTLAHELKSTPIEDWKNYLTFHTLNNMSAYIGDKAEALHFGFFGETLSGQKAMKPRWERVMSVINSSIGDQLGELYVERNFNQEAKARMKELVHNLQVAFEERINDLDWMSSATKEKALYKLHGFVDKIGFPDKWRDYTGLVIVPDNYAQNVMNSRAFRYDKQLKKLGKPVDRSEWFMTPNTVNAYYNPAFNEIVFPAAILQFPFFDFKADDAINYGGIGAVIGHEMTHGFDDQGAQYAADGNLKNWWTAEDEEQFKAKTAILVEQFNDYTVLDSVHVNGELTLGENIADLGGVAIAYQAFKKTHQGQQGEPIDGFTPDQRFFMSWGQIWRSKAREKTSLMLIKRDPHAPGIWRANGPLSNFEPFYKAFNVTPKNKMYRPESERAKIW